MYGLAKSFYFIKKTLTSIGIEYTIMCANKFAVCSVAGSVVLPCFESPSVYEGVFLLLFAR